jgi:hypothetical protein
MVIKREVMVIKRETMVIKQEPTVIKQKTTVKSSKALYITMILTFVLCGSVYSQSRNDMQIFIERTTGGDATENEFFDENVRMELGAANYAITTLRSEADYILVPMVVINRETSSVITRSFVLRLTRNNPDQTEVVQVGVAYNELTETYDWNLYLIYQAMANVPLTKNDVEPEPPPPPPPYNYWRDKWIYLAISGIYNPQFIIDNADGKWWPTTPTPFTGALGVEFQFLNFLSLEALVRPDILYYEPEENGGGAWFSLAIPLTLRYVAKLGKTWMIEPYLGAAFNLPLSDQLSLPIITPLAGVQVGSIMGNSGAVFLGVEFDYNGEVTYRFGEHAHTGPRMQILFSIGVKFGFANRKVKSQNGS